MGIPKKGKNNESRNYSLTMNRIEISLTEWSEILAVGSVYSRCQAEIGKEGKLHYQACVGFKNKKSFSFMKKRFPTCHIEASRSAMAAWHYCGKKDTRVEGPVSTGLPPAQKNVAGDTKAFNAMVLEKGLVNAVDEGAVNIGSLGKLATGIAIYFAEKAADCEARTLLVDEWHHGRTGTGKSRKCRAENPEAYIKGHNKWWCNYRDEAVVIIDDLGFDGGGKRPEISGAELKCWTDHYPFSCEGKGMTFRKIRPGKLIVTSNYSIRDLYPEP